MHRNGYEYDYLYDWVAPQKEVSTAKKSKEEKKEPTGKVGHVRQSSIDKGNDKG